MRLWSEKGAVAASGEDEDRMSLRRFGLVAACALTTLAIAAPAQAEAFDAQVAPFAVAIDGRDIPYENFFTAVPANQPLTVTLAAGAPAGSYTLMQPEGGEAAFVDDEATWIAPDAPGESRELRIVRAEGGEISLRVFIEQPASAMDASGELNGYQIGAYPSEPLRGLETYGVPSGFIEVTQANMDAKISPHFTLGQFICKQQENQWPKYVLLDEELILKMEKLMQEVNAAGIDTEEFFVMSGYRTPWYNRAIGNETTYSQHVFGGAADIYIDVAPANGNMDDLNGDGAVNVRDAAWLFDRAEALEHAHPDLVGGLGTYDSTSAHGPFVHVDSRGFEARW